MTKCGRCSDTNSGLKGFMPSELSRARGLGDAREHSWDSRSPRLSRSALAEMRLCAELPWSAAPPKAPTASLVRRLNLQQQQQRCSHIVNNSSPLTKCSQYENIKKKDVRVISQKAIREFGGKHADSVAALEAWYLATKHATWGNLAEMKADFP